MEALPGEEVDAGAGPSHAPSEPAPLAATRASGATSYRQRAATQWRGVTKTSGTNSGVEKFDVQ